MYLLNGKNGGIFVSYFIFIQHESVTFDKAPQGNSVSMTTVHPSALEILGTLGLLVGLALHIAVISQQESKKGKKAKKKTEKKKIIFRTVADF